MERPNVVDVAEFIDRHGFGRFQRATLLICVAILTIDGFNTQAIGNVAPAIRLAQPIDHAGLSAIFSFGLLGLLFGALLFGWLADQIGRKATLLICVGGFGVMGCLTARVETVDGMVLMRFLGGLGMGGALPCAVALVTEYAPANRRVSLATLATAGFSAGAALSGFAAAWAVPVGGWRLVFWIAGLLPVPLLPIMMLWLPESARLLTLRGRAPDRVARILTRIAPDTRFAHGTVFVAQEERPRGVAVAQLFREGRAPMTAALWVAFFMINTALYFLANWLPLVFRDAGVPLREATLVSAGFQVGGALGAVVIGRLCDAFRPTNVLALTLMGAAGWIALFGQVGTAIGLIAMVAFGAGFCVAGGQGTAVAYAGQLYPTYIRSTGVGWGTGAGRLGGVVGPALGGVLLGLHWGLDSLFAAAALPALCAAAAFAVVGWARTGTPGARVNAAPRADPAEAR